MEKCENLPIKVPEREVTSSYKTQIRFRSRRHIYCIVSTKFNKIHDKKNRPKTFRHKSLVFAAGQGSLDICLSCFDWNHHNREAGLNEEVNLQFQNMETS